MAHNRQTTVLVPCGGHLSIKGEAVVWLPSHLLPWYRDVLVPVQPSLAVFDLPDIPDGQPQASAIQSQFYLALASIKLRRSTTDIPSIMSALG